jgi:hypothetical protein
MPFFRKRPVIIEARQFDGTTDCALKLRQWIGASGAHEQLGETITLVIHTLEGDHRADSGDWIVQGVKGEFYPCKHDIIFVATYEAV